MVTELSTVFIIGNTPRALISEDVGAFVCECSFTKVSHRIFVKVDVHVANYRVVDAEAGWDEGGSQTKQWRPEMLFPLFFGKLTKYFGQRWYNPVSCPVPSRHRTVFSRSHGIFKISRDFQAPMEF